jgi:hypothetical protein
MAKLEYKDLFMVIDLAKQNMMNLSLPLFVSSKEVSHGEIPSLAVLEAVLTHLNSIGLLKEQVKLDYTHDYDEPDIGPLEPREQKKTVIN